MARDWYGDAPRRKSYTELAEMEARRYDEQARRESDRRRYFASGEYDEVYPGLTDEDAERVQQQAARDTVIGVPEAALTVASSILADIPAGWAGLATAGEETQRNALGENVPAERQIESADAIETVQNALTYEPRSEEGKRVLAGLGNVMETIFSPATRTADAALSTAQEHDAIPAATIPLTVLTAAMEAVPGKRPASAARRAGDAAGDYALRAEELAEMVAIAERHDPNVTRAAQAAEAGQPIPPADPSLVDRSPSGEGLTTDADIQEMADMPIGSGRRANRPEPDVSEAANDPIGVHASNEPIEKIDPDRPMYVAQEADADYQRDYNYEVVPKGEIKSKPMMDEDIRLYFYDEVPIEQLRKKHPGVDILVGDNNTTLVLNPDKFELRSPGGDAKPLGQTQAGRSQRGSLDYTGGGANVLGTQATRNVATNIPQIVEQSQNALNMDASRVAQRYPTAVAATENALNDPSLRVDIESMSPAQAEKAMEAMRQYPQYRNLAADPYEAAGQVTQMHRRNLEWLMDNVPKEILERSSQWYEGAQRIAFDLGDTYRFSPEQAAGVLAVMSPKTEWFTNVSSAERIMDIVAQGDNLQWSREMTAAFDRFSGNINDKKFKDALSSVRGRNYADLETPQEKALFIRAYDEAHNPRSFSTVTPEGDRAGNVLNQSGTEAKFGGWGVGMGPIAKAVEILEEGDLGTISQRLGTNHKIRNFYNNIIAPHSKMGDVTIDTHAVSANMLSPYGQSSLPVAHAFGSSTPGVPGAGGSAVTGIQGTYPIHAEAYREIGNAMNVPARAVQSMTWEAVRGLFDKKTPQVKKAAEQIWTQYSSGLISEGEARQKIMELAGGIDVPVWAR